MKSKVHPNYSTIWHAKSRNFKVITLFNLKITIVIILTIRNKQQLWVKVFIWIFESVQKKNFYYWPTAWGFKLLLLTTSTFQLQQSTKNCYIKRKKKTLLNFFQLSLKLITMQHLSLFSISTFVAIVVVLLSASHPTYGE